MSLARARVKFMPRISWVDLCLIVLIACGVYAMLGVAEVWIGPFRATTEISLDSLSLLRYAFLSLFRVLVAYSFSLVFTIGYGYLAAKNRTLEPILISLLDILQSIPVLGFMPGLVLVLVGLFPSSNLGLELAAVLMIFTGQAWNMVFSFYSSLKGIPAEYRDLSSMLHLTPLQALSRVELPFAANGLLWNSMLSVAGGWFFLMVIESFSLGDKDFRLPGIGSYMAVAYEQGDGTAIILGIIAMFTLIILVDRCVWAPLVVWSERFKMQSKSEAVPPRSFVLDWIKRSKLFENYHDSVEWLGDRMEARRDLRLKKSRRRRAIPVKKNNYSHWLLVAKIVVLLGGIALFLYGGFEIYRMLSATESGSWWGFLRATGLTLIRVAFAVVLGSLWTIPVGVFIGTNPNWTRRLQPVVQIVASFPIPMLFPMIAFALAGWGLSLNWGAVILLLLSSQWYILFNVIAGASLVPRELIDLARVFNIRGWHYWKAIMLPAVFPSLVNGWITAAGGAWNACIVAEWVQSGDRVMKAQGIGASISLAAQQGDYSGLAGAIVVMVVTVVLLNRFFWDALYRMAESRFRMEM